MTILRTKSKKRSHFTPQGEITAADLTEYAGTTARDKILGAGILIALTALFFWLTVIVCQPLFILASSPHKLERFIQEQGTLGRAAFLGIQILQGFLPIPLELTAVAGGFAFGRAQGTALTLCATMISTTAIFYFTRIFGHRLIDLFFTPAQQRGVKYLRDERVRSTLTWLVFLIPGTPKRIFVFSAGLVPQNFRKFLVISTLARIPALVACSFGGYALGNGNYAQAAAIFLVIGLAGVAGVAVYRMFTKKRRRQSN
jgi:uncharacterized membrane protein YdjX (TVP38/TMEM64 family)